MLDNLDDDSVNGLLSLFRIVFKIILNLIFIVVVILSLFLQLFFYRNGGDGTVLLLASMANPILLPVSLYLTIGFRKFTHTELKWLRRFISAALENDVEALEDDVEKDKVVAFANHYPSFDRIWHVRWVLPALQYAVIVICDILLLARIIDVYHFAAVTLPSTCILFSATLVFSLGMAAAIHFTDFRPQARPILNDDDDDDAVLKK